MAIPLSGVVGAVNCISFQRAGIALHSNSVSVDKGDLEGVRSKVVKLLEQSETPKVVHVQVHGNEFGGDRLDYAQIVPTQRTLWLAEMEFDD